MSKEFEYLIEITNREYFPNLNKLGKEGWELISVISVHKEEGFQDYKYFFKKETKKRR